MMPQVGDEVVIGFEHGDVRHPYVLGVVWNGNDTPGDDLVQTTARSRCTPTRRSTSTRKDVITMKTDRDLTVETERQDQPDGPGRRSLEGQTVTIKANTSLTIEATGDLTIKGASVTRPVTAAAVQVSGSSDLTRMSDTRQTSSAPASRFRSGSTVGATWRWSGHDDDIREAIDVILGTAPGERPMRPSSAAGSTTTSSAGIDASTLGRIEHDIRVALDRWEPRDRGARRRLRPVRADEGVLMIDITYRIRATNDIRNLVYPFYMIPSEEESRMSLPEVTLDDRRFQDLVNEARLRIARPCPEWTEHNVSDPGITLIELFAWMTEMIVYRLNRVPEKLHVALLDLLGIKLEPPAPRPPTSASGWARPRPSRCPCRPGTPRSGRSARRARSRSSSRPRPTSRSRRCDRRHTWSSAAACRQEIAVGSGVARPRGPDQAPFAAPPEPGDALYLGFDEPLARLVLVVSTSTARRPAAPASIPRIRRCAGSSRSPRAHGLARGEVVEDHTGGFNYGSGEGRDRAPGGTGTAPVGGHTLHWVRCRLDSKTRADIRRRVHASAGDLRDHRRRDRRAHPGDARHPAADRGARRERRHARPDFQLRYRPVLALAGDETLEVLPPRADAGSDGSW